MTTRVKTKMNLKKIIASLALAATLATSAYAAPKAYFTQVFNNAPVSRVEVFHKDKTFDYFATSEVRDKSHYKETFNKARAQIFTKNKKGLKLGLTTQIKKTTGGPSEKQSGYALKLAKPGFFTSASYFPRDNMWDAYTSVGKKLKLNALWFWNPGKHFEKIRWQLTFPVAKDTEFGLERLVIDSDRIYNGAIVMKRF